jgi:hypothetical protein
VVSGFGDGRIYEMLTVQHRLRYHGADVVLGRDGMKQILRIAKRSHDKHSTNRSRCLKWAVQAAGTGRSTVRPICRAAAVVIAAVAATYISAAASSHT